MMFVILKTVELFQNNSHSEILYILYHFTAPEVLNIILLLSNIFDQGGEPVSIPTPGLL